MSRKRKDKQRYLKSSKRSTAHIKLSKMPNERVIIQAKSRNVRRKNQLAVIKQQRLVDKPSKVALALLALLLKLLVASLVGPSKFTQIEALRITNFRVPSFVAANLPTMPQGYGASQQQQQQQGADLAKPILFDCDYEYKPDEDARLTVKWFKNKEAEPFYQWLPELNVRHFADWIKPLVNQTFVSDPLDPLKRFRSLLIRRLSMNLTGQYTCLVSSLASQDMRQSSLVVYQPPRNFTFEHRIYPAPASFLVPPPPPLQLQHQPNHQMLKPHVQQQQQQQARSSFGNHQPSPTVFGSSESSVQSLVRPGASPTQFKGGQPPLPPLQANPNARAWLDTQIASAYERHGPLANNNQQPPAATGRAGGATIVRPPNNNSQNQSLPQTTTTTAQTPTKIVYTHDGRPIKRPALHQQEQERRRRQLDKMELETQQQQQRAAQISSWQLRKKLGELAGQQPPVQTANQNYALQLHHFQCQATQVTPRPVLVITVKRDADSISQYLHESTLVSIRPYQVSQAELFSSAAMASSANYTYSVLPYAQQLQSSSSSSSPTGSGEPLLMVTLYDITVSATVALNVSLPSYSANPTMATSRQHLPPELGNNYYQQQQPIGINTILPYRRGQRMTFECHLELTGTEFEQRERIHINEQEVYQFAEAEERARLLRLHQIHESQRRQQMDFGGQRGQQQATGFDSSSAVERYGRVAGPKYGLTLALVVAIQLVIQLVNLSNSAHGHERLLERLKMPNVKGPSTNLTSSTRCTPSNVNLDEPDVVFTVRNGTQTIALTSN